MNDQDRSIRQRVCVDDYGDCVYRGQWTGSLVWASNAVRVPGYYPGDKGGSFIERFGYELARRESYIAFADNERNCNTCRHLLRVKHDRDHAGWLVGSCTASKPKFKQWKTANGNVFELPILCGDKRIRFHPDDPMHMQCYESRFYRSGKRVSKQSGQNES